MPIGFLWAQTRFGNAGTAADRATITCFPTYLRFSTNISGGISAAEPGYRKILLRPAINCGIEKIHAAVDTPHGVVRCDFKQENGKPVLDIEIPVGCEAMLVLPERKDETLDSGKHHILL